MLGFINIFQYCSQSRLEEASDLEYQVATFEEDQSENIDAIHSEKRIQHSNAKMQKPVVTVHTKQSQNKNIGGNQLSTLLYRTCYFSINYIVFIFFRNIEIYSSHKISQQISKNCIHFSVALIKNSNVSTVKSSSKLIKQPTITNHVKQKATKKNEVLL